MTVHPYSRIFAGKTAPPTVDDDTTLGFEVGDIWIDETANKTYQAVDVTDGAAVWNRQLSSPLVEDLNFSGFMAIAMSCDNGAVLPLAPTTGQWFLHTPTGRNVLMQYVGGAWSPIIALGDLVVYVDPLGADSQDKGFGVGTDAYLTIQYAWDSLPPIGNATATIELSAGTYSEAIEFTGKTYSILTVNGTFQSQYTGTVTSSTVGSGATHATLEDTGAAWTVDEHVGRMLVADTSTRVVVSNTSNTLTLCGTLSPAPTVGSSYDISDCASIIDGDTNAITLEIHNQKGLNFTRLKLYRGVTTSQSYDDASTEFVYCQFEQTSNGACVSSVLSIVVVVDCYVTSSGLGTANGLLGCSNSASMSYNRSFMHKTGTRQGLGLSLVGISRSINGAGAVFKGFGEGIRANLGSYAQFPSALANGYVRFIDCNIGLRVLTGSTYINHSGNSYENTPRGIVYEWLLGDTTFDRRGTGDVPDVTVKNMAVINRAFAQTAHIGETDTDVHGDGERIYNVVHTTEGMNAPSNPAMGDIWIDTN